jgi:hypothetical protein
MLTASCSCGAGFHAEASTRESPGSSRLRAPPSPCEPPSHPRRRNCPATRVQRRHYPQHELQLSYWIFHCSSQGDIPLHGGSGSSMHG